MKVTIEVPEMKCAKCNATAAVQPRLLFFKGQVPEQFRAALSPLLYERADVSATDSAGREWAVLADEKPFGWVKGPNESDLCSACGELWRAASAAFLAPPEANPAQPSRNALELLALVPPASFVYGAVPGPLMTTRR